jgi:hypothetical protein
MFHAAHHHLAADFLAVVDLLFVKIRAQCLRIATWQHAVQQLLLQVPALTSIPFAIPRMLIVSHASPSVSPHCYLVEMHAVTHTSKQHMRTSGDSVRMEDTNGVYAIAMCRNLRL